MATSPATTVQAGPMPGWVKGGLLAMLVFGACWGGAIWYWRATNHMPTTRDMALFLSAPLALLLAFWGGRKLIAKRTAVPSVVVAQAQPTPAASAPHTPSLAIIAASLRSPHGASVEELAEAIANSKAQADLDDELVDDDGFPLMTARCPDAKDAALQQEISEWLLQSGIPEPYFSEREWRALTLATGVVGELACVAASDLIPAEGAPPMLQLIPILPVEWQIDQRRAAGMWLRHTVQQFGWPPSHISLTAAADADIGVGFPSAIFDSLARDAATNAPLAAMVVACASNISEESVGSWAARGSLFTPSQPEGLMPGEGAAGILVTGLRQAGAIEGGQYALMGPVDEERRDSSADGIRRADSKLLGELAERAFKREALAPSGVAMIVADTGHRSRRVLELMGLASAAMPELDASADILRVGVATGTCGAVPFMTALALGRHHVLDRQAPVMCISNEDTHQRCVVLIRPSDQAS